MNEKKTRKKRKWKPESNCNFGIFGKFNGDRFLFFFCFEALKPVFRFDDYFVFYLLTNTQKGMWQFFFSLLSSILDFFYKAHHHHNYRRRHHYYDDDDRWLSTAIIDTHTYYSPITQPNDESFFSQWIWIEYHQACGKNQFMEAINKQ